MKDIILAALLSIAIVLAFMSIVAADNYHHHENTQLNTQFNGAALAIAASQHNFDWGTHKWQGSIGLGSFDNQDAISFGVAKRFDRVLINGSLGREGSKFGYGVGVNLRF